MYAAHGLMKHVSDIPTIVLTGGPCSGKTTVLAHLISWLRDRGYRVYVVPETATLLINGGFPDLPKIAAENYPRFLAIQRQILFLQMAFLKTFRELSDSANGESQVIICDRGPMDGLAYVKDRKDFNSVLKSVHLSKKSALDFKGVIHLVTAANGAEESYTLENNTARSESAEQARILDDKTQKAWWGTDHLIVIDAYPDFDQKLHRTTQALARILGIPVPIEIERKYLVQLPIDWSHPVLKAAVASTIEQQYVYLYGSDAVVRIRRRKQQGGWVYTRTRKERQSDLVRTEIEARITREEYDALSAFRVPNTRIIRKQRHCFVWESQYFELDVFEQPSGKALLENEATEENDQVTLPPFLKVLMEVTSDPAYENRNMANL